MGRRLERIAALEPTEPGRVERAGLSGPAFLRARTVLPKTRPQASRMKAKR